MTGAGAESGGAGPKWPAGFAEVAAVIGSLPHVKMLGMVVDAIEEGRCTLHLDYRRELIGNPRSGVLHGGVVTTLLDTAAGIAVYAGLRDKASVATLDMRIDYLKPARPGERVYAGAHLYRLTHNVAFVHAHAYQDEPTNQVAACAAAFMVGSVGFRAGA